MPTEGTWAVFISTPAAATPAAHLGEVPALDEVPGDIARRLAVHRGGDVVPGHPRSGVSVNEVYGTRKHVWTPSDKGDMNVGKRGTPLLKLKFLGHGTEGRADEFITQSPAIQVHGP